MTEEQQRGLAGTIGVALGISIAQLTLTEVVPWILAFVLLVAFVASVRNPVRSTP